MRLLACGSRDWRDDTAILSALTHLLHENPDLRVAHGAARGADSMVEQACRRLEVPVESFSAQWGVYGRSAGPRRNRAMLNAFRPDLIHAYSDHLEELVWEKGRWRCPASPGTFDMCSVGGERGIPVVNIRHRDGSITLVGFEVPPAPEHKE